MVHITRRERFNAAHRLFRAEWNDEKNMQVFGKCSNPNWHGHNYELFVTVKGELNPETGFVINLKLLSEIIKEKVTSKLDHKNVNLEVEFMTGKLASSENLAVAIWNEL
ncbi:MAG: 6-carboxytetrahydropterin synthase, partial [Bacteroidales bacterium]|nr:6-carboxytetrahydropterin synthase [Bacteroidales bacterium]